MNTLCALAVATHTLAGAWQAGDVGERHLEFREGVQSLCYHSGVAMPLHAGTSPVL